MGGWWGALWLSLGLLATVGTESTWAQAAEPAGSMSEARALFMAGRVAFDEGRYEAALKHFSASYEQSQRPALLYNIAQCYDRMRRDEDALAAFERYLAVEADPEQRASVEARVRALRAAVAAREPAAPLPGSRAERPGAATPATQAEEGGASTSDAVASGPALGTSAPSTEAERDPPRWWLRGGAVSVASGVVVSLTGGALMVLGSLRGRDVEQAEVGASYRRLESDLDRAERLWGRGQVLVGLGATAIVGGLVWSLLDRREKRPSRRLTWLPSVGLVGRF
ncbi:MAG: hypothetical protein RLZZ450_150 [Pseudomonadota bacterium]|jgi:tetratricopeptide (TPR) repeat protein